jgi:ATP/maltotriose-dependent transcriptional regulator MalT
MAVSGAVGGDRIARPRLVGRAAGALDRGALLVFAGPGFGKTSLLAELATGETAMAWMLCSQAEREPGALLGSLIRALRPVAPEIVAAFEERLATAPPGQVEPREAARALLTELGDLQTVKRKKRR